MKINFKKVAALMMTAALAVQPVGTVNADLLFDNLSGDTEFNPVESETMVDGAGIDFDKMETNQIEYEGEGFSVTYTVSDKWDGGYTAYIKIVNTGDEVIHNWYLEALGYDSIENIWNAQIVKSSEDTNVYKNMGWNREIAIGGQVEFGFTANKDFEKFPAYFNLVSSIDYIDSKDYSVDYKVDADWGSGFNGTITITNNSDSTIEDWSMIFSYDRTITNIWSATLVPSEDDRYVVRNSGFNADIKPGKSVTFGFSGKGGSKEDVPEKFILSQCTYKQKAASGLFGDDAEDTDGNGIPDEMEEDTDGDGIPDYVEKDTDGDGVEDYLEEMFGTDVTKEDTDGDGLTDYEELYLLETDPVLADTDEDGISDADEDADEDSLSNIEELRLGTEPSKADTDGDGITDGDEVNKYNTNPINSDTDGDGLSDNEELTLGLDPTKEKTDGTTPDSERTFEQKLSEDNFDEELFEENDVVPSIEAKVAGLIDKHVSVETEDVYELDDNRAVIGKQVEIATDYEGADLVLSFDCSKVSDRVEYLMVCEYKDGEFVPYETENNGNTISASVGAGVFFVLDVELFLDSLGITIPDGNTKVSAVTDITPLSRELLGTSEEASETTADETADETTAAETTAEPKKETTAEPNEETVYKSAQSAAPAVAESTAAGQADIVFVIDSTGSMGGAINNVVKNVTSFVDELSLLNVKVNFALVDYKDITCPNEYTKTVKNGNSNWYTDVNEFKNKIKALKVTGGGDTPETAVDALATMSELDFRKNADKFAILITDAGYKIDNNFGISTMEEMVEILKEKEINTSVVTRSKYQSEYEDLYEETDGIYANIDTNFGEELLKLARNIGGVVNDGYWALLSDYQYIKLKKPLSDDGFSSDEDSLSDKKELGKLEKINLGAFIKVLLKAKNVPKSEYDGQTEIYVYNYVSNPLMEDTDFDGINDDKDSASKSRTFTGVMNYRDMDKNNKACNVEFDLDYRKLFGSNTKYDDDLSIFSSILASDIYEHLYIDFKSGISGGNDTNTTLLKKLGYSDVENINLYEKGYGVDTDDMSEAVIGHRKYTYNGEEREIVILTIRGTGPKPGTEDGIREWSSNFDVGADTNDYYSKVGYSHPDWKTKGHHKGFDVAANRILSYVKTYLNKYHIDSVDKKSILITGHSRGAGIANILGEYFEREKKDYKSFTYTFASPFTTTLNRTCNTVFNVVNSDDLIPKLPLAAWGFKRYGTTKSISVADKYETYWYESLLSGNIKGTFEWLTGYDYRNDTGVNRTVNAFAGIANNRNELYVFDKSSDGTLSYAKHVVPGLAELDMLALKNIFNKGRLSKFCSIYTVGSWEKGVKIFGWQTYYYAWHAEKNICPAYLMQVLANLAGNEDVLANVLTGVNGKYAAAKGSFILSSGKVLWFGGIEHPHMQPTYYLIAHNKFRDVR